MVDRVMVPRRELLRRLRAALKRSRVVALVGPRQCGKTTLARQLLDPTAKEYFDLEDPPSLARLDEPMTALQPLKGLVVIDEVHRRPDLFPVLRVLADRTPIPARFLVLGSASPDLLRQSAESLAGRLEVIELGGFTLDEVGRQNLDRLWLRGALPLGYLPKSAADSFAWRTSFMRLVVERDVPSFGSAVSPVALRRFWAMLAHLHGQVWNAAEPARSLGVSEPTVRRHLDLLGSLFMVRQLQPWHANLAKRQVRSPKVYVRDTGLLHALLGIRSERELLEHPVSGASWEGFIIEQLFHVLQLDDAWFWATHQGAELDLLYQRGRGRHGVEIKRTDAPKLTGSMRIAVKDLELEQLTVIYPGERAFSLGDRVRVLPATQLAALR